MNPRALACVYNKFLPETNPSSAAISSSKSSVTFTSSHSNQIPETYKNTEAGNLRAIKFTSLMWSPRRYPAPLLDVKTKAKA